MQSVSISSNGVGGVKTNKIIGSLNTFSILNNDDNDDARDDNVYNSRLDNVHNS